jgi:hypothetical protein
MTAKKQTSVFLVTVGSYDDYHVEGVFTTREEAEGVCDWNNRHNHNDRAEVEEFPLNAWWEPLPAREDA